MEVKQIIEELEEIKNILDSYCELDSDMREALDSSMAMLKTLKALRCDSLDALPNVRRKSKEYIETLKTARAEVEWDLPMDYAAAFDYAIDSIMFADQILSLGSCNDCMNKDCGWKPLWGESQRYNCPYYKKNYQVGDVITDGKCNYLIVSIGENSYYAIQGTDFEPVSIGKDFIGQYKNMNDAKDMKKFIQTLTEKNYGD